MREQIELTFLIGYDREATLYANVKAFERDVIELACKLCGGCTVVKSEGYWMSDGAQHKQTFGGRLEKEHTLHIKLSCELEKEIHVFETMRDFISAHIKLFKIEADWVHVQRMRFTGLHFSAKEQTAKMSVGKYRDIVSPGTNLAHR
jgi:DNA-binding SARP family transcriptional activator